MTLRTKRFIMLGGVILLFILAAILVWYLLRGDQSSDQPSEQPEEVPQEDTTSRQPARSSTDEEKVARIQEAPVTTVAKTFAKRYGSYSNEARFANLQDLLPIMSESFAAETRAFIEASIAPEGFYSVTTQVIQLETESLDEEAGTAQIVVTTQREEAEERPGETEVRYQKLALGFVKEAGTWKVDSAEWL